MDGETEHSHDEHEHDDDDVFNNDGKDYYKNRPGNNVPPSATTTTPTSITICATLLGVAAMIFTAWQMSDNPDGIFASLCRLIITSLQLLVRLACCPCCRKWCLPWCCCCGGGVGGAAGGHGYHEPYGAVSTMDYGYKDPALELA